MRQWWRLGDRAREARTSNGDFDMKTMFALGALATLLVAGFAIAHTTVDLGVAGGSTYYVPNPADTRDHGVWEESNGLDGLQEEETVLEDGTIIPADTRVAL